MLRLVGLLLVASCSASLSRGSVLMPLRRLRLVLLMTRTSLAPLATVDLLVNLTPGLGTLARLVLLRTRFLASGLELLLFGIRLLARVLLAGSIRLLPLGVGRATTGRHLAARRSAYVWLAQMVVIYVVLA